MPLQRLTLPRHDGHASAMPPGSWRDHPTTVACPSCGGLEQLGADEYDVSPTGVVRPAFVCTTVTCGGKPSLVTLADWSPP